MRKFAFVIIGAAIALAALLTYMERRDHDTPPGDISTSDPQDSGSVVKMAFSGKVTQTMVAGGYTYVEIDTGKEKIWAAGPETPVEVGTEVAFPAGMKMSNFKSDTLGRTFDEIFFVTEIRTGDAVRSLEVEHPKVSTPQSTLSDLDYSAITVPDGGKDIAALFSEKQSLSGKRVTVRGRVVKFTANVMDKNWIHLRDGTGAEGSNDLTLTTSATVGVGDVIVATGTLAADVDLGFGYAYDILVEDTEVTIESTGGSM